MDEALLREACRKYDEMRMERLMQSLEMQPVHIFSKQYEKEKSRIIRQYECYSIGQNQLSGRKISKKTIRIVLVAALLLALLVASALAFEPVRHYIFSYFDGTDIIFNNDQTKDSLNESFTYIPQGYALKKEERKKGSNYFVYKDKNNHRISILSTKNGSSVFVNTEGIGYEEVAIHDHTGFFVERDECFILSWSTGRFTHTIYADKSQSSYITKEDVLRIAESRQTENK